MIGRVFAYGRIVHVFFGLAIANGAYVESPIYICVADMPVFLVVVHSEFVSLVIPKIW